MLSKYALLFGLAPIALAQNLPDFTGPYSVGTFDVELPVEEPRNTSDRKLAGSGEPAFLLETVLFTTYYPVDKTDNTEDGAFWVPRPLDLAIQGFQKWIATQGDRPGNDNDVDPDESGGGLTDVVADLVGDIRVPGPGDVALASGDERFPVVIFSHGLGGQRTWQSNYCGEIASRGYLVFSIEHRDGSAPASQVFRSDGDPKNVTFYAASDLDPEPSQEDFRRDQIEFRVEEVKETVRHLQKAAEGDAKSIADQNLRDEGKDLENWGERFLWDLLLVSGHSFGGLTMSTLLIEEDNGGVPTKGAILLDPALTINLNASFSVPTLFMDSEQWSNQTDTFFAEQKRLAEDLNDNSIAGWYTTAIGTSHFSFTDVFLLGGIIGSLIGQLGGFPARADPEDALAAIHTAATQFADFVANNTREGVLDVGVTYPEFNKSDQAVLDQAPDDVNAVWQVHVAPDDSVDNGGDDEEGQDEGEDSGEDSSNGGEEEEQADQPGEAGTLRAVSTTLVLVMAVAMAMNL